MQHVDIVPTLSRRQALCRLGSGFGLVGLAGLLGNSLVEASAAPAGPPGTLAPHFAARAKHVIFLFLNGGLSQVDTFDPKPALDRYDGQPFPGGNPTTERTTGNLLKSPFRFRRYGQSGIEVSEIFPSVGECVDDICVIRSMHTNLPIHESSLFMMNSGDIQPGRPSMGSWITYGLGTENQDLPGFVVLCPGVPVVGPPLWNSAFLPAAYQGTHIRNQDTDPSRLIDYLQSSETGTTDQIRQLALLEEINRRHLAAHPGDSRLESNIKAMEIAYRMQTEAPDVFDLTRENPANRERYGEGDFARGCLMAARLVERGVRVVQVYFGNGQPWDSHEDIQDHARLARQADRPIAALLMDLKSRGLLDETVVICGSEFGRTPVVENSAAVKVQNGRDHNPYGFTVWLAGGGIRGGMTYGATDDFGFKAVEDPVPVHDLHATVLHLLGIDHKRLTYRHSGRDFRLTDVAGNVIEKILA